MGFNQHTRGVVVQQPGLQPASADRQDRDARQQPVLADRPAVGLRHGARGRHLLAPAAGRHGGDQSRSTAQTAEEIWKLPRRHHPRQARLPRGAAEPHAQGRQAQRLLGAWSTTTCRPAPNLMQEGCPGYRNPDNFIVVSDAYPTVTDAGRRPDPAGGDVGREGRRLRQRRAPHAVLAPARRRAGRGALRPVAARGVLEALQGRGGVAGGAARQEARVPRQDAVRRAVPQRQGRQVPASRDRRRATRTTRRRPSASTCRRACSRSTPSSAAATATTSRRSTPTTRCAACAGRWSTARRRCWRYREGTDPYVKAGTGFQFYGNPDGKARASSRCPTSRPPRRRTRSIRSGCRPAACSSTGIRAR